MMSMKPVLTAFMTRVVISSSFMLKPEWTEATTMSSFLRTVSEWSSVPSALMSTSDDFSTMNFFFWRLSLSLNSSITFICERILASSSPLAMPTAFEWSVTAMYS